jgi:hypothetical protein
MSPVRGLANSEDAVVGRGEHMLPEATPAHGIEDEFLVPNVSMSEVQE